MAKRSGGIVVSLILLSLSGLMTACSAERMLTEIPQVARVEYQNDEINDSDAADTQEDYFLLDCAFQYAYSNLSAEERIWYDDIKTALGSMRDNVTLAKEGVEAGLDENCIDMIFQCVLNDHPEFFYVSGYTYTKYTRGGSTVSIDFSGNYELTREEATLRKKEIEREAEAILSGISPGATEYDKVQYVYETIVRNTDYNLNAPDNQNIYSVFVGRSSVCQGYAKAAQYLLNCLGVNCTLVQGSVTNGQGHAWNLVQVDGSYYYMDVTWGDASYQASEAEDNAKQQYPEINYDYLCITTEQLLYTHKFENCVPLPECVDMAANYYVRQGAYFEAYNKDQLKALFQEALINGRTDVTVKCADEACFQEMRVVLIDNQEIFEYLPSGNDRVSYANNDDQLSLTFWMTNQ